MPYRSTDSAPHHEEPPMRILPKIRPIVRLAKVVLAIPLWIALLVLWLVLYFPVQLGTMLLGYCLYHDTKACMFRTGRSERNTSSNYEFYEYIETQLKDEQNRSFTNCECHELGHPLHYLFFGRLWNRYWDLLEDEKRAV